ncbi:f-box only protein [Anaeramoeba ignava]|uniref:F-box only protein n=1 Tax=Anaeramoeba ignava TaxID=1746090 RepID=A0A9Q0LMJ4_ANAIG|nr:f-box only protein [Anaeramoeba ignava]
MQNQIEIEEKEIEKEIEEEKLKCANYQIIRKESYIPIYQKDFQKLKKSELIKTSFKTKKPTNEINLIFEMLFDEILLIILSYLSPGEIIIFSLTCKQAEYICSDYFLWKQIAIKFQDYFKWDSVYYYSYYNYPNIELKAIQFKIQEKNQNNPKQKQIKELSKTNEKIKNYFDNSNSTIIKTGTYNYKPNFISIKSERLIYIQNLQNPKQEIEKKAKMIFKKLKKAKEEFNYSKTINLYKYDSRKYFLNDVIYTMNRIILISTLIILNYYIDSKKSISIPKLFLLSEFDLIITIIWVIYSKHNFSYKEDYSLFLRILITGLTLLILISLRTLFNFIPWLIVLLPPIIFLISLIPDIFEEIEKYYHEKNFMIIFFTHTVFLMIVILFIGLKFDGFIEIKYSKLLYLMIIDIILVLIRNIKEFFPFSDYFYDNFGEFIGFFLISFYPLLILSLLFLYGDGIIKKLWISLIPTYIFLLILKMKNHFEINEDEIKQIEFKDKIEKEIKEEQLKSANYQLFGKESYVPIKYEHLERLKKSELISTPIKTRKPSNEINLIFEMLFDEILLIILSYLSPGEIIMFSLTYYFKWNFVFFHLRQTFSVDISTFSTFELNGVQFKIQEKNQNNPKQKQIEELSKTNKKIKNYFDNSNSTTIKTGNYIYQANPISIKSERIIYIQNLKNPKQKIEKKAKMIYKEYKDIKEKIRVSQKYETYPPKTQKRYLIGELIFLSNFLIFVISFVILNYYIDSKKEIPIFKLFLLEEISLIFGIFAIIDGKSTFFSSQEYFNFIRFEIYLLISMILISLKITGKIGFIPWHLLGLIYIIIIILFTGLKLDGLIPIKYFNLNYFLIFLFIHLIANKNEFLTKDDFGGVTFYYFLFGLIFMLLFFYADGSIKTLWRALIPFI